MKTSRIASLLAGLTAGFLPCLAAAQLEPATDLVGPGATAVDVIPDWQRNFENLSPEKRGEYSRILSDAARLFGQKRIFEALNRIAEAREIFEDNPVALNLTGACYVEFRNFSKARECFSRAYDLQRITVEGIDDLPEEERLARLAPVTDILFNIAEMDFVTKNWQSAHDRLESLLPSIHPDKMMMRRLIEFKLLIAKIKLGQAAEAETLASKYDFLDDSPFHYYANSAVAYENDDIESAERWRATARRVFQEPALLAAWEDTMIEAGYLKSFYGGDLEVKPIERD